MLLIQLREGRKRGKKSPAKRARGHGPLWTPNPGSLSTSGQPVPLSLLVGESPGYRIEEEEAGGRRPPPGVLCNQHLENSWKEEEECVCVLCTCVFSHVRIYLICRMCVFVVCVCAHVTGYRSINKFRYELVKRIIVCACLCVWSACIPRWPSVLRAGSVLGSLPANKTPPLGANMLVFG